MQQWAMLFETNSNTQSAVLADAIQSLRYQKKNNCSTYLRKAGENVNVIQQKIASVSKSDTDFDISLLPEQIAAEAVAEPSKGVNYVYDTFRANANSYLVQKVNYQLSNTNFMTFFTQKQGMTDLLYELYQFSIHQNQVYIQHINAGGD